MAARFFDIDILTRLHGPNSHHCMPVIRGCNGNSIDVFIFAKLTNILEELGLMFQRFKLVHIFLVGSGIDITNPNKVDIRVFKPFAKMATALAVDTYDCNANFFVGTNFAF